MNLLCVSIEILMISTYGNVIFGFDQLPSWANSTSFGGISWKTSSHPPPPQMYILMSERHTTVIFFMCPIISFFFAQTHIIILSIKDFNLFSYTFSSKTPEILTKIMCCKNIVNLCIGMESTRLFQKCHFSGSKSSHGKMALQVDIFFSYFVSDNMFLSCSNYKISNQYDSLWIKHTLLMWQKVLQTIFLRACISIDCKSFEKFCVSYKLVVLDLPAYEKYCPPLTSELQTEVIWSIFWHINLARIAGTTAVPPTNACTKNSLWCDIYIHLLDVTTFCLKNQ